MGGDWSVAAMLALLLSGASADRFGSVLGGVGGCRWARCTYRRGGGAVVFRYQSRRETIPESLVPTCVPVLCCY